MRGPRTETGIRRYYRATDGRLVAGVARGLADHLGVNVVLVRIAFVVLVPFGGLGALAYLIAWLLVPVEGSQQSLAGDVPARTTTQGQPVRLYGRV